MQRGFGAGRKTFSIAKIYLKFKKLRAMNAEQRYEFNAAARVRLLRRRHLKDRNEISQT